jgi:hypothetical protein
MLRTKGFQVASALLLWVFIMGALYFYFQEPPAQTREISPDWKPSTLNAIVFIGAGEMASDRMIDYSIASVRLYGGWKGKIYLLTDRPGCFVDTRTSYAVDVITVPEMKTIVDIKSLKAKLMTHLPDSVTGAIYLDVDIVVTKDIRPFLYDAETQIQTTNGQFDLAMFLDAAGHYVGFCSGCEKWHTGVVVLKRGHGQECLAAWERILQSGTYSTDQQSMDQAELNGECKHLIALSANHLLFAKDYLAVLLTNSRTFLHMTGAGRMSEQDVFYRSFALPYFKRTFSKLNSARFEGEKNCAIGQ